MEMIQGQLMYVAASFVEGVFLMFLYDFCGCRYSGYCLD